MESERKNLQYVSPARKLKFLALYINERIDRWPHQMMTFEQWMDIRFSKGERQGKENARQKAKKRCRYCRRLFDRHGLEATKDHIVALSRGGLDHKENRVIACGECNAWKGDRSLKEWLKEIKYYLKNGKNRNIDYGHTVLGTMVGTIENVLNEVKQQEKQASKYKVRK